ncbi:MAG TPA: acetolactate synthase large subunit [Candidatus Limnocylindria bacterium]|nr:acetolactate synthase large subunit [Candidatus Limnocylindria bacterium]
MNVAELVVACLENEGVRHVFALPGEETLALGLALEDSPKITQVVVRHEQGAAFMADVAGRLTSYPGVCLATLGPGATNLLTGVADATLDGAPLVALTGQAGLERIHKRSHQYVDVLGMFAPVVKWGARIELPDGTPEVLRTAFRMARLERPGATHVEIPEDVAERDADAAPIAVRRTRHPAARDDAVRAAADAINGASRPILLVGNGVIRRDAAGHGAVAALRAFVARTRIPATHTFMAKGATDDRDTLSRPAVGLQRPGADLAALPELAQADVVVCVGYDLVEWAPALWNPRREKRVVHIDSRPAEIDASYVVATEVVGEIADSLEALAPLVTARPASTRAHPDLRVAGDGAFPLWPRRVVADLRAALGDEDIVICDVGAHKVWLSRLYPAYAPNTVIVANGFAPMGIALPGAIAAKLVRPQRKVVAFSGDGGFLMNVQELETATRLGVATVCVVLVDGRYGVIEANQLRRFQRTGGIEFTNPDLVQLARAFGIRGEAVASADELLPALKRALDTDGPAIVAVPVDPRENAKLGDVL